MVEMYHLPGAGVRAMVEMYHLPGAGVRAKTVVNHILEHIRNHIVYQKTMVYGRNTNVSLDHELKTFQEHIVVFHLEPTAGVHFELMFGVNLEPMLGVHTEPMLGVHTEPML